MKHDEKQIGLVMLLGCRCRCGHEWFPRQKEEEPRVCPKCKSPYWNRKKHPKDEKNAKIDKT